MAQKRCPSCSSMVGVACKKCNVCGNDFFATVKPKKDHIVVDLCKKMLLSSCKESIAKFADFLEEMGDKDCEAIRLLYGLSNSVVDEFLDKNGIDYILCAYKEGSKILRTHPEKDISLDSIKHKVFDNCEKFLTNKYQDSWKKGHLCVLKYLRKNEIIEKKYLDIKEQ